MASPDKYQRDPSQRRESIGLTDAEKADARKISVTPTQSFSSAAPKDMCIVKVTRLTDDLGNKETTEETL